MSKKHLFIRHHQPQQTSHVHVCLSVHLMVKISPQSLLFTLADLDEAYDWLCDIRKDYSPNSDVWNLAY
jgi:hypothetical protein